MSDFRIAEFERQATLFNSTQYQCEKKLENMATTYEEVLLTNHIGL